MKSKEYHVSPKHLEATINQFRNELKERYQFRGIFKDGEIDGLYYSSGDTYSKQIKLYQFFSYVRVIGSYNLSEGFISFSFRRTAYYYITSLLILLFGIFGAVSIAQSSSTEKWTIVFPIVLSILGVVLYHFIYETRAKEFLKTFQHFRSSTKKN